MNLEKIATLSQLWMYVDKLHETYFTNHDLKPILGNGKISNPKIMFIFINPTARNISSDPKWPGPRFPFIGTKQIWRIFHRAELFNDELIRYIEKNKLWSQEFTEKVLEFLKQKNFYITNIVKWTGHDAALPDRKKIDLFLPILRKEIELVKPEYIITFGLIPFEYLTGKKIKLEDYYNITVRTQKFETFKYGNSKIIPCYFPIGRGNPKRAVELLKLLRKLK